MADLLESAMAAITGGSQLKEIRVVDTNDESKVMSKEDFAAVLGGLLKPSKTEVESYENIDDIKEDGLYKVKGSKGVPPETLGYWGYLRVEHYSNIIVHTYQLMERGDLAVCFVREFSDSWKGWVKYKGVNI